MLSMSIFLTRKTHKKVWASPFPVTIFILDKLTLASCLVKKGVVIFSFNSHQESERATCRNKSNSVIEMEPLMIDWLHTGKSMWVSVKRQLWHIIRDWYKITHTTNSNNTTPVSKWTWKANGKRRDSGY